MRNGLLIAVLLAGSAGLLYSCERGGDPPDPPDPCANATFSVSGTATGSSGCGSTGSITASASGATGLTYSIDGTNFQTSSQFSNLAPGEYTLTAKNSSGCTKTAKVTVGAAAAGPNFAAVKTIIQSNCQSCHNASNANGGMNWANECNIINNRDRIKARAVDAHGTANQMPPPPSPGLSASDRQKINDWIAAGGGYTN